MNNYSNEKNKKIYMLYIENERARKEVIWKKMLNKLASMLKR